MTRVEFIFNVEDKLAKAADLCHKEVANGRQITVAADVASFCEQLQNALWQHSLTGFLPLHALNEQQKIAAPHIPIHFYWHQVEQHSAGLKQDDVLMHFLPVAPNYFSRFSHVIELVGKQEEDKVAARSRYKFYRERGYEIKTTDMAKNLNNLL
jgi:DNA polymerase-3 subunit chi